MIKKILLILISALLILPIGLAEPELAGFGNQPPTIESFGSQYLVVGQPYSFTVNAVDAEGETLTFSDNTELFDIDSKTGRISFIPKEEDVGRHTVKIYVSDGNEISTIATNFIITEKQTAGSFKLDRSIIKVLASQGESKKASISVTNHNPALFTFDLQGIDSIAHLSAEQIQFQDKGSESIDINFEKTEPGIYTGKLLVRSGNQAETVPVILEVESEEVLVDSKLSLQDSEFKVSDELIFSMTLIDLSNPGIKEVRLHRYIYDLFGDEIQSTYEDINFDTQTSFTKTLRLPYYLRPGEYVAAIKVENGKSIGTSTQIFSVVDESETKLWTTPIMIYPFLALVMAFTFLFVYTNKRELLNVKNLERKKIGLKRIESLEHKKSKYMSQLRTLNEALRLKTISKKSYDTARERIEEGIKRLNNIITHKESKI